MWSLGSSSSDHRTLTTIVTGCATSNHTEYLSHDADTWIRLQQAHDAVKRRHADDDEEEDEYYSRTTSEDGSDTSLFHTGMQVPFAIRVNPKTGLRQVMVTRDIPADYRLWEPDHYHTFHTEHTYVEFLQELPHYLQCEALSWTHPSWTNKDLYVDITLDEGTFIQESDDENDINLDINCVTLRPLKAGEFVYMNHTDLPFAESGVAWFDDLRSTAWKRRGLGMGRRYVHSYEKQSSPPQAAPGILPGFLVLAALYGAVTQWRKKRQNQYDVTSNDHYYYGVSYFHSYSKTKLA